MRKSLIFGSVILIGAGSAVAGTFPEPERMLRNLHDLACAERLSDPDQLDLDKIDRALGPFQWGATRTAQLSQYGIADEAGTRRRDFMWNSTTNTDRNGRPNERTPCMGVGDIVAKPDGLTSFSTNILAGLQACKVLNSSMVQRLYGNPTTRSEISPPPLHAVGPGAVYDIWTYHCGRRHAISVSYFFGRPTGQLASVTAEGRRAHLVKNQR